MKALSTKSQSQKLDELASSYGLSNSQLMESAGYKASQWILKQFPACKNFQVFCGPGHNGGDAFVLAFYLKQAGREIEVFACESSNSLFNQKKTKAQKKRGKSSNLWSMAQAKKNSI